MIPAIICAACLGVLVLPAAVAQDLPPEMLRLARIKQKAADNISRLPNYICLETVERTWRTARSRRFMPVDTVKFEVAQVGGRELFSWPGARQFGEQELAAMVGFGVTGTGAFALQVQDVFTGRGPTYRYAGEENLGDRRALRYDYDVAILVSRYVVRNLGRSAFVAYRGAFWVDPETLELIRITSHAEEIPAELRTRSAFQQIDYAKVAIGGSEFLLPRRAELMVTYASGEESRNITQFTQCRKYATESVVSFEEPPEKTRVVKPPTEIELPAGLLLPIRLQTEVDSKTAAVGDPIEARLEKDVLHQGKLLVPRGALARGRVRRIERSQARSDLFVVGLEFYELEFSGNRARFVAELEDLDRLPWVARSLPIRGRYSGRGDVPGGTLPGVGSFFVTGGSFQLRRGFRMSWRTTGPSR